MRVRLVPLAAILLSACAAPREAPAPAAPKPVAALEDAVWLLSSIDGVAAAHEARLVLANGRINGQGPCNPIHGRYERLPGDGFSIYGIVTSERACPGRAEENALFDGLLTARTATIADRRLTLASETGPTLVFAPEGG